VEIAEHIEALREQGRLLAAAAAAAGLDAPVPSCPEWAVRDLVRHQGGVHRWATGIVATPRTEAWDVDLDEVVGAWPADADLLGWFSGGCERLVDALSDAGPGLVCWTFLPAPSPLAMWARRQAHETAVHRVDAELAASRPITSFPAAFASDGIDELLTCFITGRRRKLRADPPVQLRVRCTDTRGEWLVTIGPDTVTTLGGGEVGEPAVAARDLGWCQLSGPAEDLYLCLWNRRPADRITVDGDRAILDLFADRVRIRWT
jgi:uncharacterized protein (TIGR03083 family)